MKNIRELNLETIELDNQVLLVKSGETPKNWYLDDLNQIRESITDNPDWWYPIKGYRSIIASTKPLEGLPLLVIEDEVDELIDQEMIKMGHEPSRVRHPIFGEDRQLAKAVYNKAKTTYKFTEEDLRQAVEDALDWFGGGRDRDLIDSHSFMDRYIQFLTKKELWVDVIDIGRTHYIKDDNNGFNDVTGINFHKYEWGLKILEGKIKAIWK